MQILSFIVLLIYKLITLIIAPLGMAFLCYKKRRDPPYGKRKWELLGFVPFSFKRSIWFHTVSVGEVIAARPLIELFVKRHPNLNVIVTTTTTTGALEAQKIKGITHIFAPLDSPLSLRLFTNKVKPSHLFIMETELWPNMLDICYKHHVNICVFNARMPEKTCQKYLKIKGLVYHLIAKKIHIVIAQSQDDAMRFERIGIAKENIFVANSLKYDLIPNEEIFKESYAFRRQVTPNDFVIGAISTHDGEEEQILEVFYSLLDNYENLKLVLVPRHKSGVKRAVDFLNEVEGEYTLRSSVTNLNTLWQHNVIIGDSIGEIELYLGLCNIVFMGGSLIDIGGHNPLEPAYFALPILTGPYYYNFQSQYDDLIDKRAAYLANDAKRLYVLLDKFIKDKELCVKTGLRALDVQEQGRGAIKKTLELFEVNLKKTTLS